MVVIFSVALPVKIIAPFLDQILTSAPKICLLLFIPENTFVPSAYSGLYEKVPHIPMGMSENPALLTPWSLN